MRSNKYRELCKKHHIVQCVLPHDDGSVTVILKRGGGFVSKSIEDADAQLSAMKR